MTEQSNKHFIDIEPTWESLCNLSQKGGLPAKELLPACIIADKVRQSQKEGAKSVTFFFCEDGSVEFQVDDGYGNKEADFND